MNLLNKFGYSTRKNRKNRLLFSKRLKNLLQFKLMRIFLRIFDMMTAESSNRHRNAELSTHSIGQSKSHAD